MVVFVVVFLVVLFIVFFVGVFVGVFRFCLSNVVRFIMLVLLRLGVFLKGLMVVFFFVLVLWVMSLWMVVVKLFLNCCGF